MPVSEQPRSEQPGSKQPGSKQPGAADLPDGVTAEQAQAFLLLARNHHQEGRLETAESMYRQLLAWFPGQPDALNLLGMLAAQMEHYEDAIRLLREAVANAPDAPDFHANLGTALKLDGQVEAAEAALRRALELRPDYPEALTNLGALRRHRGDPDEAERLLGRALELEPGSADARLNLANVRYWCGDPAGAVKLYREAIEIQPALIGAYENLARSAVRAGRQDEAAAVFRRILDIDPGNAAAEHLFNACSGLTAARAPASYVADLFDDYAPHFDESLASLSYKAPALVAEAAAALYPGRDDLIVLDAGCGTGLAGPELRPLAAQLIGLDLSAKMLEQAKARGLYDVLGVGDLTQDLGHHPGHFDLIASVDTLVYLGDLASVFRGAAADLKNGGYLVCTLEALAESDGQGSGVDGEGRRLGYRLQPHGRFAHRRDYLEGEIAAAGLLWSDCREIVPRLEGGAPVHGYLLIARKPFTVEDAANR